jgi:transposase
MAYRIAGIDVHKKMLAVVVSDVEVDGGFQFERRRFAGNPEQLRSLAAWLLEQKAEEIVMESTAQYWKPVWETLERHWKPICEKREGARRKSGTLHLAQAQSNRGPRGRKRDFPDAERLVKRLVARELTLSFVPDAEQRLWRTVTRRKYQLTRDRVRLNNHLESLLEEAHIKLSSLVSDLMGASARRMLLALAGGETNPAALAALADQKLRAMPEQLCDALGACTELKPVYRRLLKMALEQLQFLEQQIDQLNQELASLLRQHQDAVQRLAEVPGLGVDSAQQIIAEVGPAAATFSFREMSLLVGWCLSRRRRERRRELQPPVSEGQPPHEALTQSSRQLRGQNQRKPLRDCLSPLGPAPRAQSKHWGHFPSTVSTDLAHPAPGSSLRRTGTSGHQRIEAKAHLEDDPATPKARLPDRIAAPSTQPSTSAVIFDPGYPRTIWLAEASPLILRWQNRPTVGGYPDSVHGA